MASPRLKAAPVLRVRPSHSVSDAQGSVSAGDLLEQPETKQVQQYLRTLRATNLKQEGEGVFAGQKPLTAAADLDGLERAQRTRG